MINENTFGIETQADAANLLAANLRMMADAMEDRGRVTARDVHDICAMLANVVDVDDELFEGGRDCCDDAIVSNGLWLAHAVTRRPAYSVLSDISGYAKDIYCEINCIEDIA